ncbi:MAG: hypothetical protein EA422_05815 [Gemmatimonadales bacterium]|nr:MAG: hypothetical protein EA422_05815 [Gemmatimonadales bacterium]
MNRVLCDVRGPLPGPTLVGLGGMHGNEPAGVRALEAVAAELSGDGLLRGRFVGLAGNLPALATGVRFVDRDLNRIWDVEGADDTAEATQRDELRRELARIRADSDGPIHLVDIHTTSGDGPPFTVLGDTLANRAMALVIPVPMVLGLADALPGTLIDSQDAAGIASLAFEAGQHDDPISVEHGADALWLLLGWLAMIPRRDLRVRTPRRRLTRATRGFPSAVRLVHRHALESTSEFRMRTGLRSFAAIKRGEVLAEEDGGVVRAPASGHILLPLYQSSGDDGFFVGRPIGQSWLRVSEALRRRRVERWLRFLPGILPEADPGSGGAAAFRVHPFIRRVFFPSLFRLLGYRATPLPDGRYLLVRRSEPDEVEVPPPDSQPRSSEDVNAPTSPPPKVTRDA